MIRVGSMARNLPLSVSVVKKHLGRSGPKTASVALRRGPAWIRRLLTGRWVQRLRPDVAAVALAADGRSADGSELMYEALAHDPANRATARRIAHAAVVIHDLTLAQQALGGDSRFGSSELSRLPDRAGQHAIARSVVAAEHGNVDDALAHLHGVSGHRARGLSNRLVGEREVLRTRLLLGAWARDSATKRKPAAGPVKSVLHVVSNSLPERQSGYTIRTHGIVGAQHDAGLTAQVVTRLGFPVDMGTVTAARKITVDGVSYHRLLPSRGMPIPGSKRQALAVAELTALVERERPDILHAHSKHENAQIALMVGRQLGLPVVYEARGFLEETWVSSGGDPNSDFYRWSREAETLCMQHADSVVTLSEAMARNIEARGIARERIAVIPNAVSADFASRVSSRGRAAVLGERTRARLGIPTESTVFGSVSTLNDYEGFDTVIQAIDLMADPGVVLLLVGGGPTRTGLEAIARAAGVSERVVFTGRVPHDHVREYLDAMDVFVVPRRETPVTRLVPPIKPLEAMAVGLPVLASDLSPLVEIVRPGVFGEVARAQDPAAWADRMAALRYAPEHRKGLGARAAEFVVRERTWAWAAHRYADVYAAAVRR